MEKHISLEEMVAFITAEKVDDRFRELSRRINPHINKCEKCREKYEQLLEVSDMLKEIAESPEKREESILHEREKKMEYEMDREYK